MRLCRFDAGDGPRHGIVEDGYVVDRGQRERAPLRSTTFACWRPSCRASSWPSASTTPTTSPSPAWRRRSFRCSSTSRSPASSVPDDDVHMPRVSSLLDYEGELAIVIGTRCRHVPEERAHEVIAGYTITNDVSVRDWQIRTPTMTMGKSFDTHGPLGPWIVTRDELGDPHDLAIRTYVNDELRQDGNTGEMIYDCYQQVAHLSRGVHARAGRRDRHRHARRDRRRAPAVPRRPAQGRRRGPDRDRRDRRAPQRGRRGARRVTSPRRPRTELAWAR